MSTEPFRSPSLSAPLCLVALSIALLISPGAKARTLSLAIPNAPVGTSEHKALLWWMDSIDQCTKGETRIKGYYLQSLVKLKDALSGVSAGIADIAIIAPGYDQAKLPLWYLAKSDVGSGNPYVTAVAFNHMRDRFSAIRDEEKRNNIKYISHYSVGPVVILSVDKPYMQPSDLDGAKAYFASTWSRAAKLQGWKVATVSLSFSDLYSSMERGTIDAFTSYLPLIEAYKHNEVANYAVNPGIGQQMNLIAMNRGVWKSLPVKSRECFDSLQPKLLLRLARAELDDSANAQKRLSGAEKYSMQFLEPDDKQKAAWNEGFEKANDEKVERLSKYNQHVAEINKAYLKEVGAVTEAVRQEGYPWEKK
ncbi:TRAP transporter substrate-binding protein DctP [Alloalcanivorax xenomutans]|uniref:TRAP system periplasmic protein n=1 Tax=Alloalcanivorax balearicus MACL04 TaxID=1177182 RepID=A0ABT2R404_9GAMM|nr:MULTISPECIES: TRAP transporter substrate-binding protein DctP [Alloalcanivorax]MCU5784518.1 TRAP system periplasmic protein [Alloalcanivorax balearicus MACL04]WOA32179.1 TRAP transporter substrate-binding protein DctP [Alloalcanivorax xenomutans]WOD29143.1 TRAP transporter substrate-binding protein DctP [Alloalcanivorax xenomutans]